MHVAWWLGTIVLLTTRKLSHTRLLYTTLTVCTWTKTTVGCHAQHAKSTALSESVQERRWLGNGYGSTTHALRFLGWGEVNFTSYVIKLSEITAISRAIMQRRATFTDTMQRLLSYARAVKEDYGLCFVDVRITDILKTWFSLSSRWLIPNRPAYATLALERYTSPPRCSTFSCKVSHGRFGDRNFWLQQLSWPKLLNVF